MRLSRPLAVGMLLALVLGGLLVARLLSTGPVLRTVPVDALPWRAVVDEQTGRAFVANLTDQTMSMLDTATGQLLRTVPLSTDPYLVAVDARHGHVFVTHHSSNAMSILDAASGSVLRTVPVCTSPEWPAVDEQSGHVFVACAGDDTVTLLAAQTGRLIRTVPVTSVPDSVVIDAQTAHVFVTGTDGTIAMLDANSGRLLRTVQIGQTTGYFPAVAQHVHRLFVAYPLAQTVSMLDTRTGRLLRTSHIGFVPTAIIVDEHTERVFVAGSLTGTSETTATGWGWVAVFDARLGTLLHTVPVDESPGWGIAVDTRTDHILVATGGPVDSMGNFLSYGYLDVLDGQTGRVRRRIPVEGNPQAVVVDERVGRAFVVNTNINFPMNTFPIHNPAQAHPQAAWWAWVPRWLKQRLPVLPIMQPVSRPSGKGSVTVLDLAQL